MFIILQTDSPSGEVNGHYEQDWDHPLEELFVSQLQFMSRFYSVSQIDPKKTILEFITVY